MAGTSYRQGAIVLVPFPFTDQSAAKRRPALVVSSTKFNAGHRDVVLAAITSHIDVDRDTVLEVDLAYPDIASGKILQPSVIKVAQLFTCEVSVIERQLATVTEAKLSEVLTGLSVLFGQDHDDSALHDS
jgi:mRNA interferase MazF